MMPLIQIEIITIFAVGALSCALIGVFLVLRKNSYLADTANHSQVLGLALGFILVSKLSSPAVIIPGMLAAVLGMVLLDKLHKTRTFTRNATSVIVSSVFLSAGVLVINNFSPSTRIGMETVFAGELPFAPFDRLFISGYDIGAYSFYILLSVLILNMLFVIMFYKELKISSIDRTYAYCSQMRINLTDRLLVVMTALTVAATFQIAGAFMTTALLLAPALTAAFYTKRLSALIAVSMLLTLAASFAGYGIAYSINSSVAAIIVSILGVFFTITVFLAPETGMVYKILEYRRERTALCGKIILFHLLQHETDDSFKEENTLKDLSEQMNWKIGFTLNILTKLLNDKLVSQNGEIFELIENGRNCAWQQK